MGKIRKIVIGAAAVLTAGAAAFSIYCKVKADSIAKPVDAADALIRNTPSESDVLYLRVDSDYVFNVADDLWTWSYSYPEDEDRYVTVPVIAKCNLEDRTYFYATVQANDPGMPDRVAQGYRDYFQGSLDRLLALKENGLPEGSNTTPEKLDEFIATMTEMVSDETYEKDKASVTSFTLIAKGAPNYALTGYISGVLAVLLGIVLLCAVLGIWISGKKLAIGSLAFLLLVFAIGAFALRKEIATMASIRQYAPGLYICNVTNNYKLDELLATDIRDTDELVEEASKKLLGGFPVSVDAHHYGCSSFSCVTKEGDHLFCRNYDRLETNGMVLYSAQEGSYASIAVCDLSWVNMAGADEVTAPDSFFGRLVLRGSCALMSVDGFNDQGLGISLLSLGYPEERKDTDKPDTLELLAIRAILDKCANVDEAAAFLSSYDVYSMFDKDFHLFITDKSGKSVVAEWIDDELTVTEIDHVTNYVIATHQWDDESRFVTLKDKLTESDGVLSLDEALDLLNAATQQYEDIQTEWSCVYDLDNFVLYIYNDCDRDTVYTITPETFN